MSEQPARGPPVQGDAGSARVFLGWDAPLLPRAADWLLERFGADLSAVVVALPGSRAVRRLEALLVRRAAAAGLAELSPPRILTVGHLGDELLLPLHPVAGRLLRTLLWCDALQALPGERLAALFRDPPAPGESSAWLAYAEDVRGVHAALAAEGRDFADVVRALPDVFGAAREQESARGEVARWRVLAGVQADYRARLAASHRSDPHEGRWASLRAGAFVPASAPEVVLVGVVEFNALTQALLAALGGRVTALVGAPASEAAAFDAQGAALTAAWGARPLPLERAAWCVVDTPDDQAARALQVLDEWVAQDAARAHARGAGAAQAFDAGRVAGAGAARATDVLCGVPDESVTPFLERRLAERGVVARPGTAGPFADSPAGTLLAALHDLLATGSFGALATLARHPAVHASLSAHAALAGRDPLALLDAAQTMHLPERVCGRGVPLATWPTLAPVLAALHELLGELLDGKPRAWAAWGPPIVDALAALLGARTLLPEAEDSHALHASLGVLADALQELAALGAAKPPEDISAPGDPTALPPRDGGAAASGVAASRGAVEARDVLALLLRACAATEVPPRADSDAVDLLGWLELPLDESPDLLLTGFNAGSLPAPPAAARWLPEALRTALGVPGEPQRLARDACLLTHVLHSRERVALISGRVGSEHDPLLPSPLAFQVADDDIPAQMRRWLPRRPGASPHSAATAHGSASATSAPDAAAPHAPHATRAADAAHATGARALPRLATAPAQRSMSVTGFKAYLASPYRYYLERVLGLRRSEDDAHELDPMGFGTLAHAVLQEFGLGKARGSTDPDVVRDALHAALDTEVRQRFGDQPQPAVAVQVEQLRFRLARFAVWQAAAARDGWRIAAVEWAPAAPVTLDIDGTLLTLRGRIDRIDVNADGRRWRVLDYKAGDDVPDPEGAHRKRDGTWVDLQLPLYALLVASFAAEHGLSEPPELGYLALPRDASATCERLVTWDEAAFESARDEARRIGAEVLAGRFFEEPDASLGDPILDAIAGQGLLASAEDAARAHPAGRPGSDEAGGEP